MNRLLKGAGLFILTLSVISPSHAESDFLPEDGSIKESEIITRMQKELGESISDKSRKAAQAKKSKGGVKSMADNYIELTAVLRGKQEIKGKVLLSQKYIKLRQKSGTVSVPVQEIKQIFWKDWQVGHVVKFRGKVKKYFIPRKCLIRTRDGRSFDGACNPRDWLQLTVKSQTATRRVQIYYTAVEGDSLKKKVKENFVSLQFKSDEPKTAGLKPKD